MQLMTHNLGGKVEPAANREYGKAELEILGDATLFQGTPAKQTVWMSHGDLVTEIAPGFEKLGQAMIVQSLLSKMPTANSTAYNFTQKFVIQNMVTTYYVTLLLMCGCTGDWSMENFIDMEVAKIREQVGDKKSYLVYQVALTQVLCVLLQKPLATNCYLR